MYYLSFWTSLSKSPNSFRKYYVLRYNEEIKFPYLHKNYLNGKILIKN